MIAPAVPGRSIGPRHEFARADFLISCARPRTSTLVTSCLDSCGLFPLVMPASSVRGMQLHQQPVGAFACHRRNR